MKTLDSLLKANTNDTRESPAISISLELLKEGAFLRIYDPKANFSQIENELGKANKKAQNELNKKNWEYCEDIYDASSGTDAIVILTEAEEFRNINWLRVS